MRQSPKVEPSSKPSSLATGLHPVLNLALANLDIQLEDELVRYRRQRSGTRRVVPQPGRKPPSHQLDLIAVAATGARNGAALQPASALEERLSGVTDPPIASESYKPTPAFTAQPQPFDAAIALRAADHSPTHEGPLDPDSLSVEEGDVHALAQANAPNLDDYLESSEELLRSLADEQAEVQAERGFMQSLLTPLGLGSMLLLLLSSAMFGYVIMNPSSLGWLTAQQHPSTAPPGQASDSTVMPPIPPNLPNAQLPDIRPDNLGTLNPRQASSSTSALPLAASTSQSKPAIAAAKPSSDRSSTKVNSAPTQAIIPAGTSSNNASPVPAARPQQAAVTNRSVPTRASVAPSRSAPKAYITPAPATTNRAAASTAARSTTSDAYPIKVITRYDGDSALTKSRTVVPDAYLRNFSDGAKIQLGAYGDAAAAAAKAQELRNQGIPAEVYKP